MDLGLHERVFIITGGSRGLGRATAEVLVAEGANVVLGARDPERLQEAVAALGGPDRAMGVPTDLTDAGAEERLIAAAVGRFGRIDGALLSCGGPPSGTVLETSDDMWRAFFESVFLGPLRTARAVAGTIDEGGALAFVLSTSVREPISGLSISNGLRPGIAGTVKDLLRRLAPRSIRVNGLMPGSMKHRPNSRARCEVRSWRLSATPKRRRNPARQVRRPHRVRDGCRVRAVCRRVLLDRRLDSRRRRETPLALNPPGAQLVLTWRSELRRELRPIEIGVNATLVQQLLVRTTFCDPAIVDHHDHVGCTDG